MISDRLAQHRPSYNLWQWVLQGMRQRPEDTESSLAINHITITGNVEEVLVVVLIALTYRAAARWAEMVNREKHQPSQTELRKSCS